MLVSLDDPRSLDPALVGAKAAWLARARQAGLPVLPGLVVESKESTPFLKLGEEQLAAYNSGRARMAITTSELPAALVAALEAVEMPAPLVVRSSSVLEGSGTWSGAFTSYLDIRPGELPKAVLGCYASAFTQATVERFQAAQVSPAAARIAVLIQEALDPASGGTARVAGDDVLVAGVKGSPVPLVQGWEPGVHAKVGEDGTVRGADAIELFGEPVIADVAALLRHAQEAIGANSCEWAIQNGRLWLLQTQRYARLPDVGRSELPTELTTPTAAATARLIRRYPGPLGEQFVLPWAIGDPSLVDLDAAAVDADPMAILDEVGKLAATLTAEVWGQPKPKAVLVAAQTLRGLRGTEPGESLRAMSSLRAPNREIATELLGLLATLRRALVTAGAVADEASAWHVAAPTARRILGGNDGGRVQARIGYDRWEPFQAGVITATGRAVEGLAASPGIAFGRMCVATSPGAAQLFRPRDVVVAKHPVPGLAALLFDAAALVTTGGGPAAHLFESARALAIPAVCAIRIEDVIGAQLDAVTGEWALAVDGDAATVHAVEW